ncbi:hypothetical protein [Actinokineospora fastidiosa]|uniref:Uncharacterized protein n=1 Tax=Actinokineospora fastidiosa TaxID=1816 RepID=A0A918G2S2_9PSEU|nr:hypothetical protein [Actinokineospora fastidiosa]GGS13591.1 hypothetical protein GCM10010171_01730 [Actinokineospora fastidiosa]
MAVVSAERGSLGGLLAISAVLAVFELFFLPLRFDGTLLPDIGATPFPISALVAAVSMWWLVGAAGRVAPRPAVAGAPLWVWLGTLLLFVLIGPGGDRIVLSDWRMLLLLGAGAFPAAFRIGDVMAKAAIARNQDTRG